MPQLFPETLGIESILLVALNHLNTSNVKPLNMMCLKYTILVVCLLQIHGISSSKKFQIECDSISNTDFGRRFCFIRHINNRTLDGVTFKQNKIADEKRELIFDNCTIDALPLGIFEYFPNIKTVYGWNIKLKNVTKEAFRNGDQLLLLDLSKNHIETLDEYAFYLAKQLNQLDLSKNWIQSIHVNAFSGLEQLKILNLDNNRIRLIPANSFVSLIQLKTIRLSHNTIKMIPVELFGQNKRLQNIYLNDNDIQWMFGELTFRHLQSVNNFDLHNNPNADPGSCVINAQSIDIRNTSSSGCYLGSRTKRILASNNQITFIDSNDANLTNLEHVELANNRLQEMQNLTRFEKLIHLDLMNNAIKDIDLISFANMHRLEVLNLRNSGLSRIQFGMFSQKSRLKFLDISYNRLQNIDLRMFVPMNSLKNLYLDGNILNKIDTTEIRKFFPSLSNISISENNWNCHNLASIIKSLANISIELNSIDSTKDTENINGIPCTVDIESSTNIAVTVINNKSEVKYRASTTSTAEPTQSDTNDKNYCDQGSNAFQMHLIYYLHDLQQEIQNSIQSANEAAKKLEYILNLL